MFNFKKSILAMALAGTMLASSNANSANIEWYNDKGILMKSMPLSTYVTQSISSGCSKVLKAIKTHPTLSLCLGIGAGTAAASYLIYKNATRSAGSLSMLQRMKETIYIKLFGPEAFCKKIVDIINAAETTLRDDTDINIDTLVMYDDIHGIGAKKYIYSQCIDQLNYAAKLIAYGKEKAIAMVCALDDEDHKIIKLRNDLNAQIKHIEKLQLDQKYLTIKADHHRANEARALRSQLYDSNTQLEKIANELRTIKEQQHGK